MKPMSTWFRRVKFESKAARAIREEKERVAFDLRSSRAMQEIYAILDREGCKLYGQLIITQDSSRFVWSLVPKHQDRRVTTEYRLKGNAE